MSSVAWTDIDSMLAEFIDQVSRERFVEYHVSGRVARHFLTWFELSGLANEKVNAMNISQFLRHDCECCDYAPSAVRLHPWRKRRSSPDLIRFIRILEQKAIIAYRAIWETTFNCWNSCR